MNNSKHASDVLELTWLRAFMPDAKRMLKLLFKFLAIWIRLALTLHIIVPFMLFNTTKTL